jgi:hypothetical protein
MEWAVLLYNFPGGLTKTMKTLRIADFFAENQSSVIAHAKEV